MMRRQKFLIRCRTKRLKRCAGRSCRRARLAWRTIGNSEIRSDAGHRSSSSSGELEVLLSSGVLVPFGTGESDIELARSAPHPSLRGTFCPLRGEKGKEWTPHFLPSPRERGEGGRRPDEGPLFAIRYSLYCRTADRLTCGSPGHRRRARFHASPPTTSDAGTRRASAPPRWSRDSSRSRNPG